MDINQFRNMFSDEGICRRYLENVIWASGRFCSTPAFVLWIEPIDKDIAVFDIVSKFRLLIPIF